MHSPSTVMLRYGSKGMAVEFELMVARARILGSMSRLDVWSCCIGPGMYPSDIASTLSLSPATVSHHLRVLEHAGLVQYVQQGRHRLYLATGVSWGVVSEAEAREMMTPP